MHKSNLNALSRLLYFNEHYTAIKNMSRLLSMSNSNHKNAQHFCDNCLNGFDSEESRNNHFVYCIDNDAVKIVMPNEKNNILSFGKKTL